MPNLSKPTGRTKIPKGTLGYVASRTRTRIFNLIRREFAAAGITKADLAARMGKGQDQISHWLAAPGNLTLESIGQLLFAISAAEISDRPEYPLDQSAAIDRARVPPPEKSIDDSASENAARAGLSPPPKQKKNGLEEQLKADDRSQRLRAA